jgi:hypothetical protein
VTPMVEQIGTHNPCRPHLRVGLITSTFSATLRIK